MEAKSQMMSIRDEKFIAIRNGNNGRRDRLFHPIHGSLRLECHQPAEMMTDLEYTKFMEERYGILEEGLF